MTVYDFELLFSFTYNLSEIITHFKKKKEKKTNVKYSLALPVCVNSLICTTQSVS